MNGYDTDSRRRGRRWQLPAWAAVALLASAPAVATAQGQAPGAAAPAVPPAAAAPDTASLHGMVVDSATGEPLPAAMVRLLEIGRQDLTHNDGSFHLLRLPAGRYTLVVERLGYRSAQRQVTVPADGGPLLTVRLEASAIDLPGMVVTATGGARSREETLRPTRALGSRDLQQHLDVTLAQTLENEPGLAMASMGAAPARPVIRGLGGDRILILEDGERIGDVSAVSADHAVALDPASAERIEVVRGPAALFYGSSALGGVINVVREEIPGSLADHPMGSVVVQGQSVNRGGTASATYNQAFGAVGLRAEASGRRAGDTRTPLGVVSNTDIGTYGGSLGAAWIGGLGHLGGAARVYRSEYGIPPDPVSGHPSGVTVSMARETVRGEGVLEERGPFRQVVATAGFTRYDHQEIEATGAVGTAFGQNTAHAELVGRHGALGPFDRGAFGGRAQWQDYSANTGRDVVRSDDVGGALYGLQEVDFDRVRLQVGARYDVQRLVPRGTLEIQGVPIRERTFENVSGSVAALVDIIQGWRIGASASRAFRAPTADELFSRGPHLAAYTYVVGNPELAAETGLGVDLFLRVERTGLSAEAALFWNEISGYIHPVNTGERRGPLFVYRHVNTDAVFRGGELAARVHLVGPLSVDGALSHVVAENRVEGEPLPFIPPLHGRADLRYDRDRVFAHAGVRVAATQDRVPQRPALPTASAPYCDQVAAGEPCRPTPGEFLPTDGYSVFNAAAGFRWFPGHQIHSITVRAENLTDRVYRNHLSRIKELSPEPGLGITLSYRVGF